MVVEGDDLLAGYKYTRYNNYKANLYNCLLEYENAEYFQQRLGYNSTVANLYSKKAAVAAEFEGSDPRF